MRSKLVRQQQYYGLSVDLECQAGVLEINACMQIEPRTSETTLQSHDSTAVQYKDPIEVLCMHLQFRLPVHKLNVSVQIHIHNQGRSTHEDRPCYLIEDGQSFRGNRSFTSTPHFDLHRRGFTPAVQIQIVKDMAIWNSSYMKLTARAVKCRVTWP